MESFVNQLNLLRPKQLVLLCGLFLGATLCVSCNYRVFDLAEIELQGPVPTDSILAGKLEPNYLSIFNNIIKPKCLSCHQVGGRAESFPFETYQDLVAGIFENVIIPGDLEQSSFYQVILPEARRKMPPPSSGVPAVTEEEAETVKTWIEQGAPFEFP